MKFSSSMFQNAAQMILIGLIAILPLLVIPLPWVALAQAKMILIALVAIAVALTWTIATSIEGKLSVPKSLLIAVGALLPLTYLGSALFSHAPHALIGTGSEADTAAAMVLWFALMAAAAGVFTNGSALERAYRALLISVAAVEVIQILGFLFGAQLLGALSLTSPAASIVGSWHDLGIFLAIGVLFATASLESAIVAGRWRWLSIAILVMALPLLIVVNVTDVWIAIAALGLGGTLYTWFIGWRRHGQEGENTASIPHRFSFGLFVGIFLVSTALIFIGGTMSSLLPASWRVVQTEIRPSWQGTAAVASSVYRGGGLIFGSGPNTFDRQWGLYKPTGVNETAFWNADFVQGVGFVPTAFVTVGILGALAWLAFFVLLAATSVRILTSSLLSDRMWRLPVFALVLATLYLAVMLVIYTPGLAIIGIMFLLAGLLVAASRITGIVPTFTWEFSRSQYGFAFVLVPAIAVIGIGAASAGIAQALTADMLVNHSITTFNTKGNVSASQEDISRALVVMPGYDRALRAGVELNLLRFNQLAQSTSTDATVRTQLQAALQQAISNGLSAVSADTNNYQNWLTLAGAYQQLAGVQVQGAYDNAKKAYEQALAANPTNPLPYLQLAQLSALQGDASSTRAYILEALNKKQNYADAYYLLSQLDVSQNNLTEALAAAGAAVQSAPSEPLLWFQYGTIAYALTKYPDASTALEQAVALNGNYANALYVLGFSYYSQERIPEAISAFERVLALNPDNQAVAQIVSLLKSGQKLPTNASSQAAPTTSAAGATTVQTPAKK